MTFQPDKYQRKAILTWNGGNDPTRHALLGLAGESGELLELFKKHEYKPGFDWWQCKNCNKVHQNPVEGYLNICPDYTPLVLDELGDWFYYARIVTWQREISIIELVDDFEDWEDVEDTVLELLSSINYECARLLERYLTRNELPFGDTLQRLSISFMFLLTKRLDYSLDDLTDLNYAKLNSEATAHGWKDVAIKSEVK